jgi:uncharacterized protein YgiM (DUF1202 family)
MLQRTHGRILGATLVLAAAAGIPIAAGTALLGTATAASAQVVQVSPWFAVVDTDETLLRCGNGDLMYPVGAVTRGQVLRIDGEGQGWARVWYPHGIPAFVPADAVQVDAASRTATLTKPTRLKAFNMSTGLRGSWKDVLETAMAPGVKLSLMDAEPTPDGRGNTAWRVVPPESARAFIPMNVLRRATDEEVRRHEAAVAARAASPAPEQPTAKPQTAAEPSRPVEQAAAPLPVTRVQPTEAPEPHPVVARRSPYERLESAFETVRNENPNTAEFSALMGEFEKAIARLDDSPESQTMRLRLQQRVEFLRLRAELQAQRRVLAEAQASLSEDDRRLREKLAEVDRSRQYTIVGRLSASTIYDGERLPLMYRVQTVGGAAPRTLAYVRPEDKLKIESYLGQIVGILGDATLDPNLRVNVVSPTRVDALEATATAIFQPDGQ